MKADRTVAALVVALSAALAPVTAARACGACIEDTVAATYDHAVVERAAARGDVVVYCGVSGAFDERRLRQAVRGVRGVEPQSVRLSPQPAAVSFALDPRAGGSAQKAVDGAQRGLAPGTRLTLVRVVPMASNAGQPKHRQ